MRRRRRHRPVAGDLLWVRGESGVLEFCRMSYFSRGSVFASFIEFPELYTEWTRRRDAGYALMSFVGPIASWRRA
jgi:hypothetical protein